MIQGSKLEASEEAAVRKILTDCADDEIALDGLAQWAMNPVGKEAGYGIADNYSLIMENLSRRFNVSDAISSEYVDRLRGYSTKFLLSGADISQVRAMILDQLKMEPGLKWRQGILGRVSKSPIGTKRAVYLILYLGSRGFDLNNLEASLKEIQAFYSVAFESPFELLAMQESLMDIGILNRLLSTSENQRKGYIHVITSFLSPELLGLKKDDLKIQEDTKQLISHLVDKKKFDQLRFLDDLCGDNFGVKQVEDGLDNFVPEKRIIGRHGNYCVISPFVLDEIRDDIHATKKQRLEEYESRVENTLLKVISGFDPVGSLELVQLKVEETLWRMDNGINQKIFVHLTPWLAESDSEILFKLEVPKASCLIVIVLNQSVEVARKIAADKFGDCGELVLICSVSPKEIRAERLNGTATPYSTKIIEWLSKSLNLSVQLSKTNSRLSPKEVNVAAPVVRGQLRPKILLGYQGTREVYWTPQLEKNSNIGVFGPAESGKTETVKQILLELRKSNVPFIVLDFAREYVQDSSDPEFGTVIAPGEIAINPLDLDDGTSPRDQMYRFLEILGSVYEFEDWEIRHIRDGIRKSYETNGIFEDNPKTWSRKPPTLRNLRSELEVGARVSKGREWDSIKEILQKLDLALEHPLFSQDRMSIPFEKLVTGPRIVDLSGLKDDVLKVIACEYLMDRVPYFTRDHSGIAQLFVAIDGAPKVFGKSSPSLRLLREARQRGIGMIYSYRDPINLPELAFDNTGTVLSFRMTDSKNAKSLAEHLGVSEQALNKELSEKFSSTIKFSSGINNGKFVAIPYFQRNNVKA